MLHNVQVQVTWPVVCVNATMDSEYCCHGVSCVVAVVGFVVVVAAVFDAMLCFYTSSPHTI